MDIFSRPQIIENSRQYLLLSRYFTENSRWVPLKKPVREIYLVLKAMIRRNKRDKCAMCLVLLKP